MTNHRKTKQKEYVLNNLLNRFDHPTVSQIYADALNEGMKIGEVSIYRILNNLVEEGKVCKIVTKDNVAHFDYVRENHFHLVCNVCSKIIDKPITEEFDKNFSNMVKGFNILKQDVNFYGICEECAKKRTSDWSSNFETSRINDTLL